MRGETKPDYLLRCARFAGSWLVQSLVLFAVGWLALERVPALVNSLFFMVLWAVVIPLLGAGALAVMLYAVLRWLWIRSSGRTLKRIQG
jgi:hypothetical protein